MELMYYEDTRGDAEDDAKASVRGAWNDKDDLKGIIKIRRNRQRKLTGEKNSKELHKKTLSKQLSRFHNSFHTGSSIDTFESYEVSSVSETRPATAKLISRLSTKSLISNIATCQSGTFLVSSYKTALLYSIHDLKPTLLTNVSISPPFEKGTLCEDGSLALFYGNSNGISVYDFASGSFSISRKLSIDPKVKFQEVQWAKQNHSISAITSDSSLMFFDDRILKPTAIHFTGVSSVCKTSNSERFYVGMKDGAVHLFDTRKNDVIQSYTSEFGMVTNLCTVSGNDFFAGHDSGIISFFEQNQIQPSSNFGNFTTPISDITYDIHSNATLSCSEQSFKAAKVLNIQDNSWKHLATSVIVPSHVRFSKFLPGTGKFILGSKESIFIYANH